MGTGEGALGRGTALPPTTSARQGLVIGVGCGLFGLLPWLALGQRLPLQNLWRTPTMPDAMPWAMVPLNQYYLPVILALLIVPGLVFGPVNVPPAAYAVVRWLPGLLVGLVLVWCTLRRANRLSTWVVGVLVVWLVPAAFDAVSSAVAPNTARGGLGAVVDRALEMIRSFAGPESQSLFGGVLALGLGLVGSLGVWLVRKLSSPVQAEQR